MVLPIRELRYDSREMRVETLCVKQFYHGEELSILDVDVAKKIIKALRTTVENYIQIDVVYHEDSDMYEYIGKLKVVIPNRDNNL